MLRTSDTFSQHVTWFHFFFQEVWQYPSFQGVNELAVSSFELGFVWRLHWGPVWKGSYQKQKSKYICIRMNKEQKSTRAGLVLWHTISFRAVRNGRHGPWRHHIYRLSTLTVWHGQREGPSGACYPKFGGFQGTSTPLSGWRQAELQQKCFIWYENLHRLKRGLTQVPFRRSVSVRSHISKVTSGGQKLEEFPNVLEILSYNVNWKPVDRWKPLSMYMYHVKKEKYWAVHVPQRYSNSA